ncbi:MAG: GTP-binding protein, partial [Akkermansiaceae bacterium]|nr:GTP-binding protein [Akkermansiaceae bacterium]
MDANGRELILKDEVYAIVSCAFEVLNGLGHGLHEKPYENALAVEFAHRGIPFAQQPRFSVRWRNIQVGEFIPDLIA